MLKDLKVSPRDAKEILGHARIAVTMEIYTHGDQEAHREAIERISGKLFGEDASNLRNFGKAPRQTRAQAIFLTGLIIFP